MCTRCTARVGHAAADMATADFAVGAGAVGVVGAAAVAVALLLPLLLLLLLPLLWPPLAAVAAAAAVAVALRRFHAAAVGRTATAAIATGWLPKRGPAVPFGAGGRRYALAGRGPENLGVAPEEARRFPLARGSVVML